MICGVVLAGGLGTRIGGEKAGRLLGGKPLTQWTVDALQRVTERIVLTLAPDQPAPLIKARVPAFACEDLLPARGPLTGIYTGLISSGAEAIVAAPCDAPFINPDVLELLLARRHGCDAVIAEVRGRLEPALGVYDRTCVPAIIEALNGDDYSMQGFLSRVRPSIVREEEIRKVDPSLRSFFNVNTAADLSRAESMIGAFIAAGPLAAR